MEACLKCGSVCERQRGNLITEISEVRQKKKRNVIPNLENHGERC